MSTDSPTGSIATGGFLARIRPYLHQTFFTLLQLVFVGVLLLNTIQLQWKPSFLPLVVGIPALIMLAVQLVRDLALHRKARSAEEEDEVTQAVLQDVQKTTSVGEISLDDEDMPTNPRLILVFSVWAILFVAVAWFVSFRLAVPLGLLVILWHATRSWKVTLFTTIGITAVLWVVYEYFLQVRF